MGQLVDAVLGVLHRMVWADGDADPREIQVGATVARRMLGDLVTDDTVGHILRTAQPPPYNLDALPQEGRLVVLRAAAAVAKADDQVLPAEVSEIRAIGRELSINPAVVDSMVASLAADERARGDLDGLKAVAASMLNVPAGSPTTEIQIRYSTLLLELPDHDEEQAERLAWAYHTLMGSRA